MRHQIIFFVFLFVFLSCNRQKENNQIEFAPKSSINWNYADSLKKEIRSAEIPTDTFYLKELRVEDNLSQIQNAIDSIYNQGGGTLIIPQGVFLSGPITLKSKINLHLEDGAIIKFIANPEVYPLAYTWFNGIPCMNYSPMIYAINETDIRISGKGIIDGQGTESVWKDMKYNEKTDWELLKDLEKEKVKPQNRKFGIGHSFRPELLAFVQCSRINISGVSFVNSPFWVVHPILCNDVTIKNASINSQGYDQIGIAIESSNHVLVDSMKIESVGEGIKILSGRVNIHNNQTSRDILVQNSVISNNAYSAVIVSSKIIAGANNIFMSNLNIDNSQAVFRIYGEQMGKLHDVFLRDIDAKNIPGSFFYGRILRIKDSIPSIYNINFDKIQTTNCSRAFYIQGHSENSFLNINVADSRFSTVNGSFIKHTQNLRLSNVQENSKTFNGTYKIGQLNIPRISLENRDEEILDSDDIQYHKLPENIKNTLDLKYPKIPLVDIDRMITSSNVIYDIDLELEDESSNDLNLLIQLDGKIIRTKSEISLSELPEAVLTTLKSYLQTSPSPFIINHIRKIIYHDLEYYEIKGEYNGKLFALGIMGDGKMIEEKQVTITTYFSPDNPELIKQ